MSQWRVVVEQKFYVPGATQQDAEEAVFMTEVLAKRFARICLVRGHMVRAEAMDSSNIIVRPSQMSAWIVGSPQEFWPD